MMIMTITTKTIRRSGNLDRNREGNLGDRGTFQNIIDNDLDTGLDSLILNQH